MGTGFSSLAMLEINGSCSTTSLSPVSKPWELGDLPECCVSSILKHLDPPEIFKLAMMSRVFHSASLADFIWESKLPPNYKFLVDKVLRINGSSLDYYMPKKEIYAKLCQHNRFDGGTKVGVLVLLLFFFIFLEKKSQLNCEIWQNILWNFFVYI